MKLNNIKIKFDGQEYPIVEGVLNQFVIYENMFTLVSAFEIVLRDIGGFLFENYQIIGGEQVEIEINYSVDDEEDIDIVFTGEIQSVNMNELYKNSYYTYFIKGFDNRIKALTDRTYRKLWEGSTSDIATEIANDVESESTEVESSSNSISWVSPDWTYGKILQYLANRSKGISEDYCYFWDKDGNFVFKSISKLMMGQSLGLLELADRPEDFTSRNSFSIDTMNNKYNIKKYLGGAGVHSTIWDWNTGDFITIANTISDTGQKAFTNSLFLKEADGNPDCRPFYNHGIIDDNYTENFHKAALNTKILRYINTAAQLNIRSMGDWDYAPGKVIELNKRSMDSDNPIDSSYSGKWLISKLSHIFTEDTYIILYQLIRNGLNDLENRITAPGGQAV